MSYIEKSLMEGEKIIYEAKLHPVVYTMPVLLVIIGIAQFVIPTDGTLFIIQLAIFAFLLIVAIMMSISAHGGRQYVLTNKRLIAKKGIIQRDSLELMLRKCEGVKIKQGLWGRMFNYGTVIVTTGEAMNHFEHIQDPIVFSTQINQQIESLMSTKVQTQVD